MAQKVSRFRPKRSPDLNPCDFYLWGNLKNKVYSNNPHALDELKHICETITPTDVSKLKLGSVFSRGLKFVQEQKGGILAIYSNGEFF
jgi:hypothetical protein